MDKSVLRPTQFDKDKVLLFRRTIQPISPSSGQVEDSVFLMRLGPGDPFKGESEQGPYLFLILDEEVVYRGKVRYRMDGRFKVHMVDSITELRRTGRIGMNKLFRVMGFPFLLFL